MQFTITSIVTVLLLAAVAGGNAPQAPPWRVSQEHPRIFISPTDIPDLAARCGPDGAMERPYQDLKRWVDDHLERGVAMNGAGLPGLALVYTVEKALGNPHRQYVEYLTEGLWGTDGRGGGSTLDPGRQWTPSGWTTILEANLGGIGLWFGLEALCYDWFYDDLTPQQRRLYGDMLGRWLLHQAGRQPMRSPEIVLAPGVDNVWYNQTWGIPEGFGFGTWYGRQAISPKTFVAIALHGEETAHRDNARIFLESVTRELPERFLPALNARGGIPTEGPSHGTGQMMSVAWCLEALRTGAGLDLFPMMDRTGLLAETPLWYAYAILPHNGSMAPIDDINYGPQWWRGIEGARLAMPLIASRYRQPVAQYYAQRPIAARDGWADILWLDPDVPITPPAQLPLAYHFRGSGHVYMRSQWDDPSATWAYIGAGDRIEYAWGSDDEGEFQVFKGGLITAKRARGDSSLHNLIMVYDADENTGGRPNTGGFRNLRADPDAGRAPLAAGRVLAFEHDEHYTYVRVDLTRAYPPDRVLGMRRSFLYLRGEVEGFVIYDQVEARPREGLPTTWYMYTLNRPEITFLGPGPDAAARGETHRTHSVFVPTWSGQSNPRTRANQRFPFQGDRFGAALLRPLLPRDTQLTVRGGPDYELWGNPHTENRRFNPESGPLYPHWRIEQEPPQVQRRVQFLNVMLLGLVDEAQTQLPAPADRPQFPGAELLDDGVEHVSLRVGAADGRHWIVRLNKGPAGGGAVELRPGNGQPPAFTATLRENVAENAPVPRWE